MLQTKPLECPACGHERIARRSQRLRTETGKLRMGIVEWTCQLCDYTWSQPEAPRPEFAWEQE